MCGVINSPGIPFVENTVALAEAGYIPSGFLRPEM